ncbi:TonB-dependent receptor [Methylophilaceae bacterium]|nr:TonB-dependent receptor [Methylophilaceae bacterium]
MSLESGYRPINFYLYGCVLSFLSTLNHHDFCLGGSLRYFKIIFSVILFSFHSSLIYSEGLNTDEVIVYSNKFYTSESNSAHHVEVYDHQEIINSGTNNLFNFLSNNSSLNISSYSGNKAAPSIDMRGYGLENGYQNIVINVDGYRINNIDMAPSFLGTINTNDIDRIEILKGSGSVVHGDGSNAGSINIYTKNHNKTRISSAYGNYGQKNHSFNTGKKIDNFSISFSSSYESNDGYSQKDSRGNKDKSKSSNQTIKFSYELDNYSQVNFKYSNTESNSLFPAALTRLQFNKDPSRSGGQYNEFDYNDDIWGLDYITHFSDNFSVKVYHQGQRKKYDARDYATNLRKTSAIVNGLELDYSGKGFNLTSGMSISERELNAYRNSQTLVNQANKQNEAIYLQAKHSLDDDNKLSVTYGARSERVITKFNNTSINTDQSDRLSMFETGLNYIVNNQVNLFSNFSKSMQSQDIDRMLPYNFLSRDYDTLNPNIKPMQSRTINLGLNYIDQKQKLKISSFYADLDNEIVYNPTSFQNENIDRTNKYGYEVFLMRKLNDKFNLKFNYSYTIAKILNDTDSTTFPSGKLLPGVPKNAINTSINYDYKNLSASLNHVWRDRSYSFEDFNNNNYKAPSFESTSIFVKYKLNKYFIDKNLNIFGSINNVFKQKNGVQIYDNVIYPFNFTRTWFIGMEVEI